VINGCFVLVTYCHTVLNIYHGEKPLASGSPIWLLHQDHVVIYYNYKLSYYGISGPTLHWISAFLTNRTQTVVIDGKSSSTVPVTSGVPHVLIYYNHAGI
jgi:hypothetical protein